MRLQSEKKPKVVVGSNFKIVDFKELADKIPNTLKILLAHHGVALPSQLKERQQDAEMLEKMVFLLSKMHKNNKGRAALLLNAIAYYIRDSIEVTYTKTSAYGSCLYANLSRDLGVCTTKEKDIKDRLPNLSQKQDMYKALKKYMEEKIYINSDPNQGYLDEIVFFEISKFDPAVYMLELSNRTHNLEIQAIQTCHSSTSPHVSSSIFRYLGYGNSKEETTYTNSLGS